MQLGSFLFLRFLLLYLYPKLCLLHLLSDLVSSAITYSDTEGEEYKMNLGFII